MRQYLYTSARSPCCRQAELEEILQQSRHNSALDGVIGLPWADATMFVQVLEGSDDGIASLVGRLRADPRHSEMDVLLDRSIEDKDFGAWTMAMPSPDETSTHIAVRIRALFGTKSAAVARCVEDMLGQAQKNEADPSSDPAPISA